MADNFHSIDNEIEEQDQIIEDLASLTTSVNTNSTNITNINVSSINAKLAGTSSSGLKTLIIGNDSDIANIETKTDFITVSQNVNLDTMESNIATNNNKITYPSSDSTKVGRITIDGNLNLSTMASNITTNTNGIDAIELITDNITCTQAVNLDTMESNIATNNAKVGITTTQANNITTNNSKVGITTAQANNITTNNSKVGITTTQANNISTNNSKVGITTTQSNNILNNNNKIGISLSQISAISANTSGVSALVLAYPRNTIIRHYNYTTADIYNDGIIKFNWDATNKQLRFWCLSIGTNEYLVGGVRIWKGTTEIRKSIYVSQNVSTAYKYFTDPQVSPSSSVVDNTYDLKTSYGTAEYFLCPYLENDYPTYEIKILIGYYLGWHTIHIKRFN